MKIAIIPARGGSKRIPRKNIAPFAGRPMMEWPIARAIESALFSHILVSTDDDEIAELAKAAGAEVPFRRPPELSDDYCGTVEVIAHAVRWASEQDWPVESACCIYATAPLLSVEDLAEGCDRIATEGWDYVFAAARYANPVQRAFCLGADGGVELLFPEHRLTRSQDLGAVYHDAGQFYWGTAEAWLQERPIFGARSSFVELPRWRVQDIDTPDDWAMAERLFVAIEKEAG